MPPLIGPFMAVALLVGVAGVAKLGRPGPTGSALRSAGLPSTHAAVRTLGLAEVLLALAALGTGSRLAAAGLAAAHLGFAWFSWSAIREGRSLAGCGCFGQPDTPPTGLHVTLNLGAAGVAAVVAFIPIGPIPAALTGSPSEVGALVVAVVACVLLLYALLAELPKVQPAAAGTPVRLLARRPA
jgi:hypothetical protein